MNTRHRNQMSFPLVSTTVTLVRFLLDKSMQARKITQWCFIGTTSLGATSAKFTGTMYGEIEVVGRATFTPVERISDGAIGYYNATTGEFLENQGTGTPVKLAYA